MSDWFGGNKAEQAKDSVRDNIPRASGAEQDRYGQWLGGDKGSQLKDAAQKHMPEGSGAEQDRYSGWFGGDKGSQVKDAAQRNLPQGSGAEQDRYSGWFGGDKLPSGSQVKDQVPRASGWFSEKADQVKGVVRDNLPNMPRGSGAEQDRYGSHLDLGRRGTAQVGTMATSLGLFSGAVLPSFCFQTGLAGIAYGVARYTNRAEGKDWLWPSGQVANAWWSAVGTRIVHDGLDPEAAWASLTYNDKLLLAGVTAWGGRLFYHIASRSVRRGKDDARYEETKKQPGFWNKALFTMFLPEVIVQSLIALPITLPFRAPVNSAKAAPFPEFSSFFHGAAVFLFTAGFALETLADVQLERHTRTKSASLHREGVWSIVRHPNYLGDALCHLSFPVLLYSAGMLHPLAVLGPIANYLFLRYVGGDKENEASQSVRYAKENPLKYQQLQDYKQTTNSFWPRASELNNNWLWAVVAAGAGGVALERAFAALTS